MLVLAVVVSLLAFFYKEEVFPDVATIRAFGELKADFGIAPKEPIFNSLSIAPGEAEYKHVTIVNEGDSNKSVFLKGIPQVNLGTISQKGQLLDIVIVTNAGPVYGRGSTAGKKTVKDFFADSKKGILITTLEKGQRKPFFIHVSNPELPGTHAQKESIAFDITLEAITSF